MAYDRRPEQNGPERTGTGRSDSGRKRQERSRKRKRYFSFETRVRLYGLIFSLAIFGLVAALLWRSSISMQVSVLAALCLVLLLLCSLLAEEVVRPLQTLANVISALREGDYSFRARGSHRQDALGELSAEINSLADLMQAQRLGELEATALLRRVIESMDAPVLAFDQSRLLRLINPAAERVLALDAQRDIGRRAEQLELAHIVDGPDEGILSLEAGSAQSRARRPGRWMVRRSSFRQRGIPHTLLLLSDVSSALREEERVAWQRLIRVLGHEISNSLAPIKSIAGSLRGRLPAEAGLGDGSVDFARGLTIIEGRAESLNRFVQAYRQLAQLPAPAMRLVPLRPLLERVVALETRMDVALAEVPEMELSIDPDQIEQLLINLIKNAVEAVLSAHEESTAVNPPANHAPPVTLSARIEAEAVDILVEDSGLGLTNTANLFVPFYTTKRNGSGVGLALVRQIAEAHGGTVSLRNRPGVPGCIAEVRIPLANVPA